MRLPDLLVLEIVLLILVIQVLSFLKLAIRSAYPILSTMQDCINLEAISSAMSAAEKIL